MNSNTAPMPGSRSDEDGEWVVRQFVSPEELRLEPEEYVARHAHALGAFSFHHYRFSDPALGTWIRRVGQLLSSQEAVERCRNQFLSREEVAAARRQAGEDL